MSATTPRTLHGAIQHQRSCRINALRSARLSRAETAESWSNTLDDFRNSRVLDLEATLL